MSHQKPGDRPVPSWPAIILWPFAVASLNLVSIVYVLALASIETGRTSLRAADALMKGLGEWGSALMTDAIPFATVIATLLIAVGAATGFSGNWRTVGPQARKFLGFAAIVSLVTMAGILAFALPVVVARPDRVPDVVVIFVVGWVVTLIGFAVSSVRTPDEWLEAARKERDRRVRKALRSGIAEAVLPTLRSRVVAELVVWGIPLVVWAVLGVVVTGSIGLWRFAADLVPLLLVLTTPVLLIILGWRLSLDPTPMRAIRRFARWLPWTLGLAAALSYGSTLIDASSLVVLGVVAMGYPAVLVAVVCNRRLMDRMPFVHIIATAMAARSIRRSREIVRAAKRAVRRSERERKDVALTVGG